MLQEDLNSIKVIDGGFGVQAIDRSNLHIDGHRLWSCRLLLDDPELVVAIHRDFIDAGAEVIETNTYQANVDSFVEALPDSMTPSLAAEALSSGVRLARRAVEESGCGRRVLVAGSCGPYGAAQCDLSEFTGDYCASMTEEDLARWHRPRVEALAAAGADLLAFDTLPSLREARAVVQLLREFPGLPAWLSFASRDGMKTCAGESLAEAAADPLLMSCGSVFGLGVNCIVAPRNVARAARELAPAAAEKTLLAYPNLGDYGGAEEPITEELVSDWLQLGVRWIGGCCRVGPAEIARLTRTVRRFRGDGAEEAGV
ncbi:hypothetical protein BOX15_Mlig004521g1 [Macrostomum lignano]|uniref:Uncharacterized protein n=2 Tax=Macrostomum lignano TaxID=282301 RepID=A0A267DV89_9PLAT|nr:hypothetical protein BOX15_Mlig004521g1 [Macrostomum lignano]